MTTQNDILPIAIVSPHGGLGIPPELNGRIALTPEQIFNEADAYVDEIFDFSGKVLYYETFPYSRGIVDLNRPKDGQFYHRVGDGIVKEQTSYGNKVFLPGHEPDEALQNHLIDTYWQAWHNKLEEIANDTRVKLVIDAHSMAGTGPSNYENPHQTRPRLMVGNMGGENGAVREELGSVTASPEFSCWLAAELGQALGHLDPWSEAGEKSAVNKPYRGGWDIYAHGGKNQPWVMIEISRAMYIGHQEADSPIVPLNEERISALREGIWSVFCKAVDRL
ncbi:MAG: N-formylglutamate amidohydrolase [Chloroflexota bacterium]